MIPIVCFFGQAGSGKDTAGAYFTGHGEYVRLSLADELKWDIIKMGLATEEEAFTTKPPHIRLLLQKYGTEICRKIHGDDYWLWRWAAKALEVTADAPYRGLSVADVRFPNEASWFLDRGAVLIHIKPNARSLAIRAAWGDDIHVSEEGYRTIPEAVGARAERLFEIDNDKTPQDLYDKLYLLEQSKVWPFASVLFGHR